MKVEIARIRESDLLTSEAVIDWADAVLSEFVSEMSETCGGRRFAEMRSDGTSVILSIDRDVYEKATRASDGVCLREFIKRLDPRSFGVSAESLFGSFEEGDRWTPREVLEVVKREQDQIMRRLEASYEKHYVEQLEQYAYRACLYQRTPIPTHPLGEVPVRKEAICGLIAKAAHILNDLLESTHNQEN